MHALNRVWAAGVFNVDRGRPCRSLSCRGRLEGQEAGGNGISCLCSCGDCLNVNPRWGCREQGLHVVELRGELDMVRDARVVHMGDFCSGGPECGSHVRSSVAPPLRIHTRTARSSHPTSVVAYLVVLVLSSSQKIIRYMLCDVTPMPCKFERCSRRGRDLLLG